MNSFFSCLSEFTWTQFHNICAHPICYLFVLAAFMVTSKWLAVCRLIWILQSSSWPLIPDLFTHALAPKSEINDTWRSHKITDVLWHQMLPASYNIFHNIDRQFIFHLPIRWTLKKVLVFQCAVWKWTMQAHKATTHNFQ